MLASALSAYARVTFTDGLQVPSPLFPCPPLNALILNIVLTMPVPGCSSRAGRKNHRPTRWCEIAISLTFLFPGCVFLPLPSFYAPLPLDGMTCTTGGERRTMPMKPQGKEYIKITLPLTKPPAAEQKPLNPLTVFFLQVMPTSKS